jgi:hypothetical protein
MLEAPADAPTGLHGRRNLGVGNEFLIAPQGSWVTSIQIELALAIWAKQSVHVTVVHNRRKEHNMAHSVVAAIEQLRTLNVIALRKKYQHLFGDQSRSSNKQYLFRRIAWRLQANAEGGLSERACHRAVQIADEADLRTRAPKDFCLHRFQPVRRLLPIPHNFSGTPGCRRPAHYSPVVSMTGRLS